MSTRTTVTSTTTWWLRVKRESRSKGASFRSTLNDLLRSALAGVDKQPRRRALRIKPGHMGYQPGLNYDSVESLIDYGEGEGRR